MHELSIAQALTDQVVCFAEQHHGARVAAIGITIGRLSGVDRGALEMAFPVAAEGTAAESARLEVQFAPAVLSCDACGGQTELEEPLYLCGRCGSDRAHLTSGTELLLTFVELEGG